MFGGKDGEHREGGEHMGGGDPMEEIMSAFTRFSDMDPEMKA